MARSRSTFSKLVPGCSFASTRQHALNAPGSSIGFADASTSVSRARLVGSCRTDACQSDPASVPWTERVLQQNKSSDTSQTKLLVRLRRRDSKDKICDRPLQMLERAACRNFSRRKSCPVPQERARQFPICAINISTRGSNYVPVPYVSPEPDNRPTTLAGPSLDIIPFHFM